MRVCEVDCVVDCCGINAFDISSDSFQDWKPPDKQKLLTASILQIESLISTFADNSPDYCSSQLNHCVTGTDWIQVLSAWKVAVQEALTFNGESND